MDGSVQQGSDINASTEGMDEAQGKFAVS